MDTIDVTHQSSEVQPKNEQPKMSEAGQRRVLKLYWTKLAQLSGKTPLPEEQIDAFTTRLLEVTSHATSDRMIFFMGIRMKMQMVAEIVEDHVVESTETSPPEALDLLQLLDRFVDKKFNMYVQEKFNIKPSDVHYEYHVGFHRKEFLESHMEAALALILGDHDFKKLEPKSIGKNYLDFFKNVDNGDKTDFVDSMVGGKPRFVHTVFAEYFAAKWFAEHFAENATFLAKELYTSRFNVIRSLVDRILARDCELHVAVLDRDLTGVRHLLDGCGVDANVRDRAGRLALHLAAAAARIDYRTQTKTHGAILDLIIDATIDIEVKDEVLGGTPLLYADTSKSWTAIDKLLCCKADTRHLPATSANVDNAAMLSEIFERDLDKLMAFCLDHGLPVEHIAFRRLLPQACDEGSLRVATLLIARGAVIDAVDAEDVTPLSLASASGHLDMVRLLVLSAKVEFYRGASKKSERVESDDEQLEFQDAVAEISHVKEPSFVNAMCLGTTALHQAADNGHADVAAYLISEGADVFCLDEDGGTPLHKAVEFGQRVVPILLDAVDVTKRASYVDITDKKGNTALHIATMCGSLKSVHLLHKAGGSLKLRNNDGQTPLIAATESGRLKIVQYLVDSFDGEANDDSFRLEAVSSEFLRSDHINDKDINGMSALHTAARHGHASVANYLIGKGAYIRSLDSLGRTPLHYAAGQEQEKSLGVLLGAVEKEDRAGFVNLEDEDGNTALHRAAQWGRLHALEHLVKAGGSLNQLNKKQQTPAMIAAEEDHQEVVTLLNSLDN